MAYMKLVPICHREILQLIPLVERRDPSDPTVMNISEPLTHLGRADIDLIDGDTTQLIDQVIDVARRVPVVIRVFDDLVYHDPKLPAFSIVIVVIVYHPQGRVELEFSTDSVYVSVLALEVLYQVLQRGVRGYGIEMSESEAQTPTFGKEFRTLEEAAERGLEATKGGRVGSDSEGGRLGARLRGSRIKVVGKGDPMTACDFEDLMLDITVEGDVCKRGRRP